MKKIYLSALLALFVAGFSHAQTYGEIKGRVIDSITGDALPGTTVYVEFNSQKIATSADLDGYFTIKPLQSGMYNVYAILMSYNTRIITSVPVNPDKITFVDEMQMVSTAVYIASGAVITDHVIPLINPEDPSKMVLSHKEITANADSKNIANVLRSTYSDIYVSESGDEIYFRGSREEDAVYYVDGVKQINGGIHVPSASIGSLTVYSGGVPAKYGDFTGGVIVIETRSYFEWVNEQSAKKM
jgi:hypothetical protein